MKPLAEIGLALIMLGGCRMAEAPAAPQGFSEPIYTTAPVSTAPSASDPPGYNPLPPAQPSGMTRAATPSTGQSARSGSSPTARKPTPVPWIVPPPAAPITSPTRLPEALPQSADAKETEQPPPPDWSFLKTTASESAKPHQASPSAGGISQAAAAATDTMPAMVASPTRTVITRPGPAASDIRLVNSKRISLNYKVNNVGPSGVTAVELWCTRDGRTWKKLKTFEPARPPCIIDVDEEDLYGFTLVVRSGADLGKPPQEGDQPQVWVEVDTTRPVVRLMGVEAGQGTQGRSLVIRWKATDKNLALRPITLRYATQAAGPWKPIATQLENTGYYLWHIPNEVPHHLLVRVEAADLVGNVGVVQTTNPLLDDLSQPTASILAVEGKGN